MIFPTALKCTDGRIFTKNGKTMISKIPQQATEMQQKFLQSTNDQIEATKFALIIGFTLAEIFNIGMKLILLSIEVL